MEAAVHTNLACLVQTSDVGFMECKVVSSVLVDTAGARVEVEEVWDKAKLT